MKLERWRQVDQLLDAALERAASERSDFLKQACEGDEELRSYLTNVNDSPDLEIYTARPENGRRNCSREYLVRASRHGR